MDKLKVNIPDKDKADLKKFISLEHEKRSLFLQKLSVMPLIFPPNDFEAELSETLKIESGEAHSIIQLIINIFSSTDQSKVTVVDFLRAVEDDLNFNKHDGAILNIF
ncbi:MAG: hypothetical protein IPQ05_18280 [Leptospiraceae bacterium]|nr:hypothetical protein [Leptospiraceae bacterium]